MQRRETAASIPGLEVTGQSRFKFVDGANDINRRVVVERPDHAADCRLERAQITGASPVMPTVQVRSQLTPIPLLGVISPWNAPLMLSLMDAVPALLAGCAAIIKPSDSPP